MNKTFSRFAGFLVVLGITSVTLFAQVEKTLLQEPLTVSLFVSPLYAPEGKYNWHLSINSMGRAHLIVHTPKAPVSSEFVLSAEAVAALRELVKKEEFFSLKAEYGDEWTSGHPHETVLTIGLGYQVHTVTLGTFANALEKPGLLTEPVRALRVLVALRALFKHDRAQDDTEQLLSWIRAEEAYKETEEAQRKADADWIDGLVVGIVREWTKGIREAFFEAVKARMGADPELFACWMEFIEAGGCMPGAINLEDLKKFDIGKKLVITQSADSIVAGLEFDHKQRTKDPRGGRFAEESELFFTSVSKLPSNHWVLKFEFDPQTKYLRTLQLQQIQRDLK